MRTVAGTRTPLAAPKPKLTLKSATSAPPPPVTPRPRKPRKLKSKRELPEVHAFRARNAKLTRKLPKKLQGPAFAHILATDVRTLDRRYSKEDMADWSATFAPRYKLPVATPRTIQRYDPELAALGLYTKTLEHVTYVGSSGVLRTKQVNRYVLDIEALERLAETGNTGSSPAAQSKGDRATSDDFGSITGSITGGITGSITGPHIVSNETASRSTASRSEGTEESATPHHHGPDDDGGSSSIPSGKTRDRAKGSVQPDGSARAGGASSASKVPGPDGGVPAPGDQVPGDPGVPPDDRGVPAVPAVPPVPQDDLTAIEVGLTRALDDLGIEGRAGFSMDLLTRPDQQDARAGLVILSREGADWRDVVKGIIISGGHTAGKLTQGAQWLNIMFRGAGEPELRKWADQGREHYAAQERAEREEADQARAEEAERAAMLAKRDALLQQLADLEPPDKADGTRRYWATVGRNADISELIRQLRQRVWQVQANLATEAARERAWEEGQKAASAWTPTLEGVYLRNIDEYVRDDPRPFYIEVRTLIARPCRGKPEPYEAKVLIRRTSNGPALAKPDGEAQS